MKGNESNSPSCPILCDPTHCSPPGSSIHRISYSFKKECLSLLYYFKMCQHSFTTPKKLRHTRSALGCIFPPLGLHWWLRWYSVCLQLGRPWFDPWVRKILWRRNWQPTPVLLPGIFHGQRSLAGYSPWGHKESDTTEWLHFFISHLISNLR